MDDSIAAVRHFNRFYTKQIGILREGLLNSPYSLTQVRVLYELAHRDEVAAVDIGKELGLDKGYLSRLLLGFKKSGLIDTKTSKADGRQSLLSLTKKGRTAFASLDARSSQEIADMLKAVASEDRNYLVQSMKRIQRILGGQTDAKPSYTLRPHAPGDMGTVVQLHGALYAREYGFDHFFEALVAKIAAEFLEKFDPKTEHCWIAEKDGEVVGSIFLVRHTKSICKLRLLLVDPRARGLGIGGRLVSECIRFAQQAGYKRMTLWTQSILIGARKIYEQAGFELVKQEPHQSFGRDLIGETWELKL